MGSMRILGSFYAPTAAHEHGHNVRTKSGQRESFQLLALLIGSRELEPTKAFTGASLSSKGRHVKRAPNDAPSLGLDHVSTAAMDLNRAAAEHARD